jgi:hypothetical protein
MKSYKAKSGPFNERPYYTDADIESTCTDELRRFDLLPNKPSPIRIERFIEKRFLVSPEYDDLPDGVLGLTRFGLKGVQGIVIARALDEEGTVTSDRRVRTTLAHETGHGLLHAHLFIMGKSTNSLFGDFSDPSLPKVLCWDVPVNAAATRSGYDGRWWEYQANRTIGPLLMPRALVQMALEPMLKPVGTFGEQSLPFPRREDAIKMLANTFEVNRIVAKIRLDEIYPVSDAAQLRL